MKNTKKSWGTAIALGVGAFYLYSRVRGIDKMQIQFRNLDITKFNPLNTTLKLYMDAVNPALASVTIRGITGEIQDSQGRTIGTISQVGKDQIVKGNDRSTLEIPISVSNLPVIMSLIERLKGATNQLSVKVVYALQTNIGQITGSQVIGAI